MTKEDASYARAVRATTSWPVRPMANLYANDALMEEYSLFTGYAGEYYQNTPNWAAARTAWWQMLQAVGRGEDISAAVRHFTETANGQETLP